ncbi:SDR family NAD(P)-dependent oxidoreductase [Paenibacillus glucanolyticus]|uniref:SDR family NAD(P)-dependent oxidoreductase n=1 Tax=Paenibacillus TaxID=44249 RepID=UPI0003E239D3|nr:MULTISPECIES: SDR family NAD(P)-dependent oxidoreductase [Paenibacillus]AVV58337.1 SDR family NAD(P)-dependent oxidoreductase [Paenibacillus glucanolyticus]ETT42552.1 3-oxoacyl-ACP reductase [Paenibacillus sp. FSL R5-808]MCA4752281.1 SDR family oxidoreductase [Mycolicibacterium fortuitum]
MNKTVLITGATRGIGRCLALRLARHGYRVAVNGTRQPGIDCVVEDIRQHGGEASGYCADVANPDEVTAMVNAIVTKYGNIDVLIHNAGNLRDRKCMNMTDEEWNTVIDVHLNGAFYCIRRVLPHMTEHGGDIVLMTSTAGLKGSVGQVNYSAAKAGMLGMVWTLSEELRRYRIRINAIAPAALTDMTRPVIEFLTEKYAQRNEPFPEHWKVGESDDVACFVKLLLEQPDTDLTGETFGVNGSDVTLWQKPSIIHKSGDAAAIFDSWRNRRGGGTC